jgi:hypothetical protein
MIQIVGTNSVTYVTCIFCVHKLTRGIVSTRKYRPCFCVLAGAFICWEVSGFFTDLDSQK